MKGLDAGDTQAPARHASGSRACSSRTARRPKSYFAEHASHWDEIRSLHVPERQVEAAMLLRAGAGPFRAMLDIGTGTGRMLELFAGRYERALGVDLSPAMLAVARANLERAGDRPCARAGSATS